MPSFYPARHVTRGVWIGSEGDCHDAGFMRRNRIRLVVNCSRNIPFAFPMLQGLRVPVDDSPHDEDVMEQHLPRAVEAICESVRSGRNVLVHCYAGQQRSATVVAAWLMASTGLGVREAKQLVKAIKPETFPMPTFTSSLAAYRARHLLRRPAVPTLLQQPAWRDIVARYGRP